MPHVRAGIVTRRLRPSAFVLAIGVAAALVLSAPFVGQVRAAIRQAFPGHFVLVVGSLVAAGLAAALATALIRVRERRLRRYSAIAVALLVAAGYAVGRAGDNPESNVVELFHFLQYGLITWLFYRAWRPLGDLSVLALPVIAGLIVGTAEEWLQWFIPNRVGEMNDVVLNLVAIGCGLLFSVAVDPPGSALNGLGSASRRVVARLSAVAVLAFAGFFHVVHLGHNVRDASIGSFVSRYPGDQLLALEAERAATWSASPPPVKLVRLSREDQYLTEGVQHVRWRNRLWAAGDIRGAWQENLILETYYAPVLDTPTHEGAGHRWPPEQRADAAQRGAQDLAAEPYISAAYPYPLYTWPPAVFWTFALLTATTLAAASRRRAPGQVARRQSRHAGT